MPLNIKHKRKWLFTSILIAIILLLPGLIGQLIHNQFNQQLLLTSQAHNPPSLKWEQGWWKSHVIAALSPAQQNTAINIQFEHGPVLIKPFSTELTRWNGSLDFPSIIELPINGRVSLTGHYQLNIDLPNRFIAQEPPNWVINNTDPLAQAHINGSFFNQILRFDIDQPDGGLATPFWQSNWQDLHIESHLEQPSLPLQAGSLAIQTKQLNWQMTGLHDSTFTTSAIHGLDFELNWPANDSIQLSLHANQLKLPGHTQTSGSLNIQVIATSIERIALQQWLNAQFNKAESGQTGIATGEFLALAGLLAAQPSISIEALELSTPNGLISLQGNLKLHPNRREAKITGHMPEAAATWLAEAILNDTPPGLNDRDTAHASLQALIRDGWIQRNGDQLVIDVVLNL